eukprot:1592533-Amphidinium_carterae.1
MSCLFGVGHYCSVRSLWGHMRAHLCALEETKTPALTEVTPVEDSTCRVRFTFMALKSHRATTAPRGRDGTIA